MSDLAAAAAAATGVPETLIERAAAARAEVAGVSTEEILQAWAGGGAAPTGAASPPPDAPEAESQTPSESAAPAATPDPVPEPAAEPAAAAVAAPSDSPPAPSAAPAIEVPETVGVEDAADWPVVTTVASASLKERTESVIPRWLMSVFVVVPFFALGYLLVFTSGTDCGNSGQLSVDRFGRIVNCDGSPFQGKATASAGQIDFFALGAEVYGRTGSCAGCHGDNGEGGAGPAFAGGAVTAAFSVCEEHVVWVRLGTQAFGAEVGQTYGDLAKPVGGGGIMPGFGQLTDDELRAVVLYERVRYGGEAEEVSLEACGLAIPEEATDDVPAEGESDGEGNGEDPAPDPMSDDGEGIEASAGSGS